MTYLFWFSVFMIFYAYFGYPLVLMGLSFFKKNDKKSVSDSYEPEVSFIITAYNEEKRIRDKIEETLGQDYPPDKIEIIVASDCSNDATDSIVVEYENKGVKLVRVPERGGKENAQGYAVKAAKGEILIFSDVSTILQQDGVSKIVHNFRNPKIGCVSSEDRFIETDGTISGEGAYVRYEMFLRKIESRVNTLVGLSGSFFAARREVCQKWAPDLQSDFNTLLNSIKLGLVGISDPESIGYYKNIIDEKKEFKRKVRTVLRGLTVFFKDLSILNPFKYGLFSWQIFSHKFCRWIVPFFLIAALISNLVLVFNSGFYMLLMVFQICFYLAAFLYSRNIFQNKISKGQVLKIPYFFVIVNISILFSWFDFLRGKRTVFWEPSKR